MSWCDGMKGHRLMVCPAKTSHYVTQSDSGSEGCILSLIHPKSGNSTSYMLKDGLLQEFHWFKQPFGSWFLGDYVCEDGSLYINTPVDPIFILLPIFNVARLKKGKERGMFRQLDEILFVNDYPSYQRLLSLAEESMPLVCEVKEFINSSREELSYAATFTRVLKSDRPKKPDLMTHDSMTQPKLDREQCILRDSIVAVFPKALAFHRKFSHHPVWAVIHCGRRVADWSLGNLYFYSGRVFCNPACANCAPSPLFYLEVHARTRAMTDAHIDAVKKALSYRYRQTYGDMDRGKPCNKNLTLLSVFKVIEGNHAATLYIRALQRRALIVVDVIEPVYPQENHSSCGTLQVIFSVVLLHTSWVFNYYRYLRNLANALDAE
ncbi:hypothetical protein KSP40_PGU000656 [Platanthera guangdongensis]|uniref:Rnh202 triple barrel domain-containing protein n=1 Tax=Platanthera guangdongensis TaxID=2320717 RepID=A0ABR2LKX0_9ASPA